MPSSEARRLLACQKRALPGILQQIQVAGPATFRKHDHWAWYVWPTTKVGFSDPQETACTNVQDIAYVLACEETRAPWTKIFEGLTACLHIQKTKSFLPSIDHGRIDYFVKEWIDGDHEPLVAEYPQFHSALHGFVEAWDQAEAPPPGRGVQKKCGGAPPAVRRYHTH